MRRRILVLSIVFILLALGLHLGWLSRSTAFLVFAGHVTLSVLLSLSAYRRKIAHWEKIPRPVQEVIAIHEAGHAVFAWHNPFIRKVKKVSLLSEGRKLAYVHSVTAGFDGTNKTLLQECVISRIGQSLAGIFAEKQHKVGHADTNPDDDLRNAYSLALVGADISVSELAIAMLDTFLKHPEMIIIGRDRVKWHEAMLLRVLGEQAAIGMNEACAGEVKAVAEALLEKKVLKTKDLEKILGPKIPSQNPRFQVVVY